MKEQPPLLHLDWCSYKAAKYACENWHYSKCMPVSKLVKIGVWEGGKYKGVIIFSLGTNNNLGTKYELKPTEVCELTRVALDKHYHHVTKMMSIAIKMLKKLCPGLKLVVSYADPEEGHEGVMYKAGNWIHDGFSEQCTAFIVDGRKVTNRSFYSMKKRGIKGIPIKVAPKIKFIYPLSIDMREKHKSNAV